MDKIKTFRMSTFMLPETQTQTQTHTHTDIVGYRK